VSRCAPAAGTPRAATCDHPGSCHGGGSCTSSGGARHHDRERRAADIAADCRPSEVESEWVTPANMAAKPPSCDLGLDLRTAWAAAKLLPAVGSPLHLASGRAAGHQPQQTESCSGDPGPGRRGSTFSQGVRWDHFRREEGTAMTMFGIAALLRARGRLGPNMGGYLHGQLRTGVDFLSSPRGRPRRGASTSW